MGRIQLPSSARGSQLTATLSPAETSCLLRLFQSYLRNLIISPMMAAFKRMPIFFLPVLHNNQLQPAGFTLAAGKRNLLQDITIQNFKARESSLHSISLGERPSMSCGGMQLWIHTYQYRGMSNRDPAAISSPLSSSPSWVMRAHSKASVSAPSPKQCFRLKIWSLQATPPSQRNWLHVEPSLERGLTKGGGWILLLFVLNK